MEDRAMVLSTEGTRESEVLIGLYPALTDESEVDLSATLRIPDADLEGALVSAGFLVRIGAKGVSLVEDVSRRIDATGTQTTETAAAAGEFGFANEGTDWHTYRLVRSGGRLQIFVDGEIKLERPCSDHAVREVRFGSELKSVNLWRSVSARVTNPGDYSIDWSWEAASGKYPDQFRRDRMVVLDYTSDSGYSGWTQRTDGFHRHRRLHER